MPPLSLAAFTRCFSRLDDDDRLEFVAALWSARGWQTRRDDDCVLARDGDDERRIRVYTPGFFGSPQFDGVDVLVVTDEDESVADEAAAHGVRYVGPTALRDRLLYSLPREDAERLAQTYLGRPLTTPATPAGSGSSGGRSGLLRRGTRLRQRLPDSNRLLVLVVLLCVVGVAAAGPALLPTGNASTTVPEGTGNYTPGTVGALGSTGTATDGVENGSAMPPGLSKGEVTDPTRLAAATATIMEEKGWVLRAYRDGPDRTVWRFGGDRWTTGIRVANETQYRSVVETTVDGQSLRYDTYADGETVYEQRVEANGSETSYVSTSLASTRVPTQVRSKVQTAIVAYLSTSDTRVSCAGTLEGTDDCFAYRIVADGRPDLLADVVENYSARATVSDTGLVTSLVVEYTVPDPRDRNAREWVRFGFTFDAHGNVTVNPPGWLSEATAATGTDTSATQTASTGAGNATATVPSGTETE